MKILIDTSGMVDLVLPGGLNARHPGRLVVSEVKGWRSAEVILTEEPRCTVGDSVTVSLGPYSAEATVIRMSAYGAVLKVNGAVDGL
jgi:hypothetical protein